jgi:predicted AAA+ superfamily ATPase
MVLKADIEKAYHEQQKMLKSNTDEVPRGFLKAYTPDKKYIEVITGIRRSGKSTVLKQIIRRHFRKPAFFNFEDVRIFGFDIKDFPKLDSVMPSNADAYCFDEIQNVDGWETYIRQLHDRGAKIFITGSNASLLSSELGTRLTGRHLRHEMFPLSFPEFLKCRKLKKSVGSFDQYLNSGGFPEYLLTENPEILQMQLRNIVLRDIAIRHNIRNTKSLMEVTLFLLSNIGNEYSYNGLKKNFGMGSANTASDYVSWLEDKYLLFFLPRFSWSAKNTTVNPRKVYAIDTGMVNANTLSCIEDKGRLLENVVYLYLRQQPYTLYYFREQKECDFVVFEKRKCKFLIQVCWEINSDTLARETEGLLEAMQYFKQKIGFIITHDQRDTLHIADKILYMIPAYDFISGNKGLGSIG